LVPDSEIDPEATLDRLNTLSDTDRQAYDAAEGTYNYCQDAMLAFGYFAQANEKRFDHQQSQNSDLQKRVTVGDGRDRMFKVCSRRQV
jgi:hypothetical protein